MAADTGQRVGDYEVLAPLGAGGMGRVYKVRNIISNREEAMKILLPDFASDPDLAARFMAEIRTLAGLDHPGIAQLRTAFEYQNQFVMVMEYVEGTTLEKLAAQIRIPLDRVIDLATQVLAALSYAHSRGVTHRDIKPANIMITTHGLVKLMDFGIAKSTEDMQLTRPGTTMGSVYYMSPEQVRGEPVGPRSDIYSFGVTLYEMLTGRKPFQADTSYTVLNAQLNQPPTPPLEFNPAISAELNAVVLRALAKSPNDRYQTAEEFREALRALREPLTAAIPTEPVAASLPMAEPNVLEPPPAPSQAVPPLPAFTPVVMPPTPPTTGKSHRGLWIGLGAVTAILALVAVAALVPRYFLTHAGQKSPAVAADTQTPATSSAVSTTTPATTPDTIQAPANQLAAQTSSTSSTFPATSSTSPTATSPGKPRRPYVSGSVPTSGSVTPLQPTAPLASIPAVNASEPPPGPSAKEVRDAHDRYANVEARADAALAGVQQIRSQQQAQGLDIRGDILAAMNRLHNQLNDANRALAENDIHSASEYMDRAEGQVATLEKFLGR